MTGQCDSNLAQYERNRKFGHLVHALGREAGGATLPSVGLRLNASKAESALVVVALITRGVPWAGRLEPDTDQARASFLREARGSTAPSPHREPTSRVLGYALPARVSRGGRSWVTLTVRRRDSESSVDDLRTKRGVVLGRAVATLRSVETHPFAWRIRFVG
jgi:hypothetical protein